MSQSGRSRRRRSTTPATSEHRYTWEVARHVRERLAEKRGTAPTAAGTYERLLDEPSENTVVNVRQIEAKRFFRWAGGYIHHKWVSAGHETRLGLRNLIDRDEPARGTVDAVVSMTSYGKRLRRSCYLALESIARGSVRPARLILWVQEPEVLDNPPAALQRLVDRGLEMLPSPVYRSHTKYLPYVQSPAQHTVPLVTADDDIIYPYRWLEYLTTAHRRQPGVVTALRAHHVGLHGRVIAPYLTWRPVETTAASHRVFPTGVSGVLYPPAMLNHLHQVGEEFLERGIHADDIWLHYQALRAGIPARQAASAPVDLREIDRPWDTGLFDANGYGGANDAQISSLYTADDVEHLISDPPVA